MNKVVSFSKNITKILSNNFYFVIFYLIINLCFVTILKEVPFLNLLSKIALLWGICLSFYHFIKILKRKPSLQEILLYFFLAFTLLLNLLFYRDIENIKIWIINLITLTGIFYIDKDKTQNELNNELNKLSYIFIFITFTFSIISTLMYTLKINFTISDVTYGLNQGLYVYKNTLSIASGISLILSIYCYLSTTKKNIKYFHIINILLQIFNVLYSKGRSALLLLLAIPFVIIYIKIKNNLARSALVIIPSTICIAIFAKFHDSLYDFLSARNELWYSACLLIKRNLLCGVGNVSLVEKVYNMRPDVILPGIELGGLHNIYLQIITANGLISFVIIVSFLSITIYNITKMIDLSNSTNKIKFCSLLILIWGILFVNLFESNLIYISSFISIIFWSFLSYTISITQKADSHN